MKEEDKKLLENLFDSLDRLFDRENSALDVYALMFATKSALSSSVSIDLGAYISKLNQVVTNSKDLENQTEEALEITGQLRGTLDDLLSE